MKLKTVRLRKAENLHKTAESYLLAIESLYDDPLFLELMDPAVAKATAYEIVNAARNVRIQFEKERERG